MDPGKLRHRVQIQQRSMVPDENGEYPDTWTTVDDVWSSIEDLSGREYFAAAAVQNSADTRITIRYRAWQRIGRNFALGQSPIDPAILPTMRVIFETETYNVLASIDPTGKRRYLQLMCRRAVPT